ncbi:MAG: hypothetical protein K6G70_05490, partial [Bacteroidaceae bacterium]|nr:hypothetical protein [Bacteroidaceae bacterium]
DVNEDIGNGSYDNYDFDNTIEISYTVMGDSIENTFDMDVKEREYEWLTKKDDDGEYLDSDFISENRRGLHKRILRAIHENIEEEEYDGYYIDDDDIEYTVTL